MSVSCSCLIGVTELFLSFYLSFSLLDYATLSSYLNDLFQRENKVSKPKSLLVLLHCG